MVSTEHGEGAACAVTHDLCCYFCERGRHKPPSMTVQMTSADAEESRTSSCSFKNSQQLWLPASVLHKVKPVRLVIPAWIWAGLLAEWILAVDRCCGKGSHFSSRCDQWRVDCTSVINSPAAGIWAALTGLNELSFFLKRGD